ncbi:MAG: hypothetical protein NXI14_08965 [bacterium]|nr:hypothetical protein [bacterium]
MQRISDAGMEWLDYTAKALPRYPVPEAETLSELLSKLCGCEVDLTIDDLNLDQRVRYLAEDGPEVADALVRMAHYIETWEKSEGGAWRCPDRRKFATRLDRLDSLVGYLWVGVGEVMLDDHLEPGFDQFTPTTTLARLYQILEAGQLLPQLRADLSAVIESDAYEAVATADALTTELSRATISETPLIGPRVIRRLRSAAADLRTGVGSVTLSRAVSLTQAQIVRGAGVSDRTVRTIASNAGIQKKTGGAAYTAEEVGRILEHAKHNQAGKPGYQRVASYLASVVGA